jgi:minor extracellular serine protease Vpr
MKNARFFSAQLTPLLSLALAFGLYIPGFAGSTATSRHGQDDPITEKTLQRMMIPNTKDLQLIIELSDPGVLEKMSGSTAVRQFNRTERLSRRNRQIDLESQQALEYRHQIRQNRESFKNRILQFSGAQILGTTDVVMNAVIVQVHARDYRAIRNLPGVKKVYFSRPHKMLLDQAAILQNAQALWTAAGGQSSAGMGIKIGLIDSGIDISNPMLSGTGMSAPGGFPRYDTQADKAYTNSKVIVARSYVSYLSSRQSIQTAVDEVGHGTFVAGCAAGQQVTAPRATISGMAPGAYLGSYKVFGTPGVNDTATTAAILAAIDDAVTDGMDVINLSLGGLDYVPPSEDVEAIALQRAIETNDIVVTIAAGNDGTMTHTIGSPGTTDDAITVGAVTNSREFLASLHANTADPNLSTIGYLPASGTTVPAIASSTVIDVQSLDGNGLGCSAFPSNSLSGSVALIERGNCLFSTKVANAATAGAKAVIVYNNVSPGVFNMSGLSSATIPAVMISQTDGVNLKNYIDSNPSGARVSVDNSQTLQSVPVAARVISSFSSAGPNMDFGIKPDLVAVGENVYSAATTRSSALLNDASGFTVSGGTSFSSPMAAGAAAALRQRFPSLGALAIKSLLTTTASRNLTVDGTNAPNVMQAGSGLLNMENAFAGTALFSPTNLNFGVHSYQGSYTSNSTLAINNISSASDQFTLGFEPIVGGASITFDQNNVSIASGSLAAVRVSIQVASPNSGGFQGFITAKSSTTSFVYRIPYWTAVYVPDSTRVLPVSQTTSSSGSYKNLNDALAAAQPGNVIEIQDSGNYSTGQSGIVISTNGQGVPLHGITIRAASGQTPSIDGSALSGSGNPPDITIVGVQNVLLRGLTINGGYTGVELNQPSTSYPLSATIDHCTISGSSGDSGATGIWIDGGGNVEITQSTIDGSAGTGIVAGVFADGTQLTVLNSTVQGNQFDGMDALGSNVHISASSFTGNSGQGAFLNFCSGTVEGSTFAQNQANVIVSGDGLEIVDGNVNVRSNLFSGNSDSGLLLTTASQSGLGLKAQVLGNTIRQNGNYGLASDSYFQTSPSLSIVADSNLVEDNAGGVGLSAPGSVLLLNNIIVRSTSASIGDGVMVGTSGTTARMINNTIYQNALHGVNQKSGTVSIANSIIYANSRGDLLGVASGSASSSLISKDPVFVNAASDDFSLAAGSPAIDAGSNAVSDLPFLDFTGRLRVSSTSGLPGQGTVDIGAEEANSKYALIYPLVISGNQSEFGSAFRTGIALSNPTSSTAQVSLTAYGDSGAALSGSQNPASEPLSVEGQFAILDYQLFGFSSSASTIGSVLASSESKLAGFDLFFDENFSQFSTGANASSIAGGDIVFMRHEFDANGTANYVIFNPGVNTANITATLFDASGTGIGQPKAAVIPPKGQVAIRFDSSIQSSGYVRIQSDRPVSGVEIVGKANRQAALGGFSPDSQARLYFPHFAVGGGYSTQVGIVNSAASAVNLNLTAYDNNGNMIGSREGIALAAGGQLQDAISNLFGISVSGSLQTGYLIAQGDRPGLMGFTDYTFSDGIHNPEAIIPADSVPRNKLIFSHIAQGVNGYETGIALLNPFGTEVPYIISVYDGTGKLVGQAVSIIGPHQKVAKILSYPDAGAGFFTQNMILGNGHVEVTTDYGLTGLELFFTADLSQLASVPAQ